MLAFERRGKRFVVSWSGARLHIFNFEELGKQSSAMQPVAHDVEVQSEPEPKHGEVDRENNPATDVVAEPGA